VHKKVNPTSFRQFPLNKKGLTHNFAIDIYPNNQNHFFKENLYITFWLQNEIKRIGFLPIKIELQRKQVLYSTLVVKLVLFNKFIYKLYFLYKFFKNIILRIFQKKLFFLHLRELNIFLRKRKLKRRKISYKKRGKFVWERTLRLVQKRNDSWSHIFQKFVIFIKNYKRIVFGNSFLLKTLFYLFPKKDNLLIKKNFFNFYYYLSSPFIRQGKTISFFKKKNPLLLIINNAKLFLTLIRFHISSIYTARLIRLRTIIELQIRSFLKSDAHVHLFILQPNTIVSPQLNNLNMNNFFISDAKKAKNNKLSQNIFIIEKEKTQVLLNNNFLKKKNAFDFFKNEFFFFKKKISHIKQYRYASYKHKFFNKIMLSRLKFNKIDIFFINYKNFIRKILRFWLLNKETNFFALKKARFYTKNSVLNKNSFVLQNNCHLLKTSVDKLLLHYILRNNFIFSQDVNLHNYSLTLSNKMLISEANNNNMLKLTLSHKNSRKYGRKFDPISYRRYLTFKAKGFIFLRNHIKLMIYGLHACNVDIFAEAFCRAFKKIKKHRPFFTHLKTKLSDMLYTANIKTSLVGIYIRIRGKHDEKERRSTFWIRLGEPLHAHDSNQLISYSFRAITTKIGVFGVSVWFVFDTLGHAHPYTNKI
jgi:hypothetical protein